MDAQRQAQGRASNLYRALETGDRASLSELLHPDFVGHATPGLPLGLGGTYEGPRSMGRDFWGRIGKSYALKAMPAKYSFLSNGELLVEGDYVGKAIGGADFRAEFMHLIAFKDSRISGLRQLTDSQLWAQALADEVPESSTAVGTPVVTAATSGDSYETLLFEVSDGLATLTLNRPAARNAIDLVLAQELLQVAIRLTDDDSVRAVHIRGNGPVFTVGGDIKLFGATDPAELPGLLRTMTAPFHQALTMLSELRAPIICEVNGAAAGGGLGLIYVADIVIAGESAKFASGFSTLGLSGDGGNSWYLPKLIGVRRAASFYFEQKVLSAQEASEWGLITRAVPDEQLHGEALKAARQIAQGPTVALGKIRTLLHDSWGNSLPAQLVAESNNLAQSSNTSDAAHAVASFAKKQSPAFKGK